MTKKKISNRGRIFLALFALPFAAIGIVATVFIARAVWSWNDMQNWVERPATILQAELETNRGSDSTTYRVTARYEYKFNDVKHEGTRVGIHGGWDNVGSFHQKAADQLKQHQKSRQPFPCYVDPSKPADSILYRDLRFEMLGFMSLFSLLFGSIGFGLLFWSIYSVKLGRAEDQLVTQYPDHPWNWKPDWAEGQIRSSNKKTLLAAAGFAAFWNLISAPVVFFVPAEVQKGNHLALLGLIFPAVGLGLAYWAMRCLLHWLKYGESVFEMAAIPGVIGGQLAGVVRTKRNLEPTDGFRVTLKCVNRVTTGGKNSNTSERIVWQDTKILDREIAEYDLSQSVLPIQFEIPFESRPSNDENQRDEILWRLEVRADTPGIDYTAQFGVPVFKTKDSSPDFQADTTAIEAYVRETDPAARLVESGVRIEPIAGGKRWLLPPARQVGGAVGLTVFLAIWIFIVVLLVHQEAPWFFPIVFGLFALLPAWGVLDLWMWSSRIDASYGMLTVTAGILGMRRTRSFTTDAIREIKPTRGTQMGKTLYYGLRLVTQNQQRFMIAKRLTSHSDAEYIADEILQIVQDEENAPSGKSRL